MIIKVSVHINSSIPLALLCAYLNQHWNMPSTIIFPQLVLMNMILPYMLDLRGSDIVEPKVFEIHLGIIKLSIYSCLFYYFFLQKAKWYWNIQGLQFLSIFQFLWNKMNHMAGSWGSGEKHNILHLAKTTPNNLWISVSLYSLYI